MKRALIMISVIAIFALCSCTDNSSKSEQPVSSELSSFETTASISETISAVPPTTTSTETTVQEASSQETTVEETVVTPLKSGVKGSSFENSFLIKQEDGKIFSDDGKYTFSVTFSSDEIHVGDEFYVYTNIISNEKKDYYYLGYLGKIDGYEDFAECLNTTESWTSGYGGFSRKFKAIQSGIWNIEQFYQFSIDIDKETIYYESKDEIIAPLEILV